MPQEYSVACCEPTFKMNMRTQPENEKLYLNETFSFTSYNYCLLRHLQPDNMKKP